MLCKVFIFGRPGSGKSIAVYAMENIARERGWKVEHLRDYGILYKMFTADVHYEKFKPAEYDGFDVIEFSVLLEALDQLKQQIIAHQAENLAEKLLFVELARDDYNNVLDFFSREDHHMLQNTYVIFVRSDIETCIQRIHERVKYRSSYDNRGIDGIAEEDHHFVSEHILRTYYHQQNFDTNLTHPVPIHTIDNDGTREEFLEQVHQCIETLLAEQAKSGR